MNTHYPYALSVMAKITATLAAEDEVPSKSTGAKGVFELDISADGAISDYKLSLSNTSNVTSVHLHQGARGTNGPVVVKLYKEENPFGQINGILSEGKIFGNQFEGPLEGKYISDLMRLINEGLVYINVYTKQSPEGEVRGQLLNVDRYIIELEEITRYFDSTRSRDDIPPAKYLNLLHRLEELASLRFDRKLQAKVYFLIAYCLHSSNLDFKRALDNYNLALESGHDEFWVTLNRGVLYTELGDIDAARLDLGRATTLNPNHAGAKQFRDAVFLPRPLLGIGGQEMTLAYPVVLCSVPKSGTILLRNILKSILGDNVVIPSNSFKQPLASSRYLMALPRLTNRVYVGHIEYSDDLAKKLASIPKVVLIRDPRDYVISYTHFMDRLAKDASGAQKDWYEKYWNKKSWDEKLSTMIFGLDTQLVRKIQPSVSNSYLKYAIRWSGPNTLIVRYEDIAGTKFGGSDRAVTYTMKSIMDFIGVQIDEGTLAQRIAQGSDPIKSDTFRSGGKGNWKQEFKPQHVTQMKAVGPKLLSTLGYELDEDWDLNTETRTRFPPEINTGRIFSSIDSLLKDMPVVTMPKYLKLRRESEGKKVVERLIDEWAVDSFIENKQYQDAAYILEQLLRQEPNNPLWNYLYALSLHQIRKDMSKALRHYNSALENGYEEFWIKYNRGLLLIEIGNKDAGVADLERAKRLNPEHKAIRETMVTRQTTI